MIGIIYILFLLLFTVVPAYSQTFYGVSGNIITPTADVLEFRKFNIGAGYFRDSIPPHKQPDYMFSYFLIAGILPQLEVSLRVGGIVNNDNSSKDAVYYDRMVSIKANIIKEKKFIPAVSIGIQDLLGRKNYNSLYFVLKKTFYLNDNFYSIVNLGYGTKLWNKITDKAKEHRFTGLFGNIENNLLPFLSLINEYDGKNYNVGIQYNYKKIGVVKITLNEAKYLSSIISLNISL